MASNPMQRKTRNSFLLGIIVTLFITGAIIVLLLSMLKQKDEALKAEQQAKKSVYVLSQNVKSGQILTQDMFTKKSISTDSIPSDATALSGVIDSWFLQTKEGEPLYTDKEGLYLKKTDGTADAIIEVLTNTGAEFEDSKGNKVAKGETYVNVSGVTEKVTSATSINEDEFGGFFVDTQGKDRIIRVYEEPATGEFYMFKIDMTSSTTEKKVRVKEYIDIKNVPVLAKVNMNANTVITKELVIQSDEQITNDTRQEEYNVVVLPVDLMTDDYIDIRLMAPNGQNFIVVSKAKVEIPANGDGTFLANTVKVNLREEEILSMSSAIVEAAGMEGAKLYAVKYVDPVTQEESYPTYISNAAVTQQLAPRVENGRLVGFDNPNILEAAEKKLVERYSNAAVKVRNDFLQPEIDSTEDYKENVAEKMEESIGSSIEARQKYLESLNFN